MPAIRTCLWFDGRAEEAAKFYCSLFPRSKLGRVARYGKGMPGREGAVMTVEFEIAGMRFLGLNGGPGFPFTQAVSFMVECRTQKELDGYWKKLSKGGGEVQCGWLTDRFGLSWQVVPSDICDLISDRNPRKRDAVMQAVMGMTKLDAAALRKAARNAK